MPYPTPSPPPPPSPWIFSFPLMLALVASLSHQILPTWSLPKLARCHQSSPSSSSSLTSFYRSLLSPHHAWDCESASQPYLGSRFWAHKFCSRYTCKLANVWVIVLKLPSALPSLLRSDGNRATKLVLRFGRPSQANMAWTMMACEYPPPLTEPNHDCIC